MEINLAHDSHWTESDGTVVCGNAFLDGTHLSRAELAERISTVDSESELRSILSQANGFFSVIHRIGERIYAAVDHVRSWPLYYAVTDDIYISDSAEWVHTTGTRSGYDPTAVNEYLFTCYTSGKDTLSKGVKQVRAGELVRFRTVGPETESVQEQYYKYDPSDNVDRNDTDEYDERLVKSFQRLIDYADGRKILVGLSSGYDSRLIALMLRRLGYDNTVTYTTRTASASRKEMEIAESIADDLDFEHIEITTEQADYEDLDNSPQLDVIENVGYLSEYPHINKFVLRQKLQHAGVEPNDVVHVLGHQFISAGEFLPAEIRDEVTVNRNEFFDIMWALHYSNWIERGDSRLRKLFESRMLKRIPTELYRTGAIESVTDVMKGFEQWYWRERLPKFILARREYEYLGFDMWYPLLDREICSYYEQSSYRDKVGRRILEEYVDALDSQMRSVTDDAQAHNSTQSMSSAAWQQTIQLIHKLPEPAKEFARQTYYTHLHDGESYDDDPRYSIVSETEFNSISVPILNYRTLLLLYLYDSGYFDVPVTTEFERAFEE